jgi:uncharacterized protein YbjT (DUF2867 family)
MIGLNASALSQPDVLIIGATGRHGNTGATVVDQLIAHAGNVRVLTRADDERAEALRRKGAATVIGDLHARSTLQAAVDGVSAVYFTYPIAPGVIPAAANLASVLVELGQRPHVVVMSMAVSSHDHPSALGRAQAIAEEILIWAGLNPTVLRVAALFHENVLILHSESIRQHGVITNSFGAGRTPWISGQDAAELAVHYLLQPPPPTPVVSYPPGAEALSHAEIAEIISAHTGQKIEYQPISHERWRDMMASQADSGGPVNPGMAQHISIIGAGFASGKAPAMPADPEALATALGRPPTTFAQFVRKHREEFAAALT